MLAGWEAGRMPMGEPLVRELVSPVSGGAWCSGHKRQCGRRAGEQHDCTFRGGGVEARSGQQGAILGGFMITPGCLGEDRQNSRGSSPSATPGCPQPLEHGPNLGGPCAPAGVACLEAWGWRGDSTPLPELLQLGSRLLGALPAHSQASCGSFVPSCPLERRFLSGSRDQPTHPNFPTTTQGQKPAAAQPTPAGEEG